MGIKAFIIAFNEADIIGFTIKHYQKFCSEIHIYDNFSTDDTRKIASDMGCIVHTFGQEGVLDDREYLKVKNNCWKEHKDADLVIVCDADEILKDDLGNTPNAIWALRQHGALFRCTGYDMYSETLPQTSWEEIECGYSNPLYNKAIVFYPSKIKEINYGYGCHGAKPILSNTIYPHANDKVNTYSYRLFHMRYIGGIDRLINRYDTYRKRMCGFNMMNNLGNQYFKTTKQLIAEWDVVKNKSEKILLLPKK